MRALIFAGLTMVATLPALAQSQSQSEIDALVATVAQDQPITPGRLNSLRFVDIRDLATFGTSLAGTANLLMRQMQANPARFAGSTHLTFYPQGPQGPAGAAVDTNGKDVFSISADRSFTYKNTILSAEIEDIVEEQYDKVFRLKVILFAHDDSVSILQSSNGYYFRRLTVRVDWTQPRDPESGRIQVLSIDRDIPLASTNFRVLGDLLARKVILEDPNLQIRMVFPVAVGSFDVRTGPGMDGVVKLMTQEFPNAKMKKVSLLNLGSDGPNTRSRTYPSYYTGRPFLGLFQNGTDYEQVGMHYQITSPNLVRGFVSHGCMRVRDMNLYVLDAILNEGPLDSLDVHIVNHLDGYESLDHPMPKVDDYYNAVVYSTLPTPTTVQCEHGSYSVRNFGSYHTVTDEDCLTMVSRKSSPSQEVTSFLLGQTSLPPQPLFNNVQHYPIAAELGDQQPDIAASEGGDAYKVRQQERYCTLFGCRNRPVRTANPGQNAPLAQRLDFADSEIAVYTDRWNHGCRKGSIHLFGPSRKTCNDWAAYVNQLKQFKAANGQ